MKSISFILSITILSVCLSARAENANSDMLSTKLDSITFAALDSAVDSDKSDLVTATILKGKYKGNKLQGELTHTQGQPNKYQLIFTSLKLDKSHKSIKVTAYGIDPDTARTALKGKVSDEYLSRHGKTLSTSFLQGKSESYDTASLTHRNDAIMPSRVKISSGTNIGVLFVSKIGS